MKKQFKQLICITILLLIVLCFILLIFKITKKSHKVNYEVGKYTIKEVYQNNQYDILVKKGKNNYFYTINNEFGKNKKIIIDIKKVDSNDLKCIIPIYKKNNTKRIYCILDNKQVSIDYLNQIDNNDYKDVENKIKKLGIKIPNDNTKKKTYKEINYYQKNFNDEKLILWNYKGIYVLGKDGEIYQKILKKDLYDNIMSCTVDKYFVLFDNSSVKGIENVYYYDLKKNKLKSFKLDKKVSKNTYINGVVDNLIYITDKKNKIEYTVDITHEKINDVDKNQTEYVLYQNGKKSVLSKSDFLAKEQYFNDYKIENEKIDSTELREYGQYYYYFNGNDFYKTKKGQEQYSTLLFQMYDVKEWFVKNDTIYLTKQDSIYSYSEATGMKKLIEYNELRYNYKNIYKIWEK